MIRYQALIEKDGSSYIVSFPDLPGWFSSGDTRDEAAENAREALSLYLEEARDPKWDVRNQWSARAGVMFGSAAFVTEPASIRRILPHRNNNPSRQRAPPNPTLNLH